VTDDTIIVCAFVATAVLSLAPLVAVVWFVDSEVMSEIVGHIANALTVICGLLLLAFLTTFLLTTGN
jgi:hypothetical protein